MHVMSKHRCKLVVAFTLATVLSLTASAAEYTGSRTIVSMGCDDVDTICAITLSGASFGSSVGCVSNTIAWDSINDPNGKNTLAELLTAFTAGLQINVYIAACSTARPTFPTISYLTVYN
jgi:hypothetical protein